MLVGRLIGAALGSKISSKKMLSFTSLIGLVLVLLAILWSEGTMVSMPAFKTSGASLSFGLVPVPLKFLFLAIVGLCTSIMWGGIFNLAVEGLGKYLAAASGIFMVLVCGGGIIPALQGWFADITNYVTSYWLIVICLGYLLFYAQIGCKNVNKNITVA